MVNNNLSAVHPEIEEIADEAPAPAPRVRRMMIHNNPGMPGTLASLLLRLCQLAFFSTAVFLICQTVGLPYNFYFRYLFLVLAAESSWSLMLSMADICGLVTAVQAFKHHKFVNMVLFGDVLLCLMSVMGVSSSAGVEITMMFDHEAFKLHHCGIFIIAIVMALMSMACAAPSMYINCLSLRDPP